MELATHSAVSGETVTRVVLRLVQPAAKVLNLNPFLCVCALEPHHSPR